MRHNSKFVLALNSVDIAVEIVSFIQSKALLPVALSCKRLYDGVKQYLFVNQLLLSSSTKYFVNSVSLVKWALENRCTSKYLC